MEQMGTEEKRTGVDVLREIPSRAKQGNVSTIKRLPKRIAKNYEKETQTVRVCAKGGRGKRGRAYGQRLRIGKM